MEAFLVVPSPNFGHKIVRVSGIREPIQEALLNHPTLGARHWATMLYRQAFQIQAESAKGTPNGFVGFSLLEQVR